ncbi:restriction endonuclease subunit S [Pseudomonas sp. FP597]|uniref:restriction endonuclease subunit S n=1 Tax=Pseudomonas sp. FP597 TaxID=2954096 RepID=UPI00273760F5|nr:restriction endonuclease subunit S [Pseudomonas sp. FP597]WLI05871.1 restriction endonuclease subunit S [Pseudomonas sp. FP597]
MALKPGYKKTEVGVIPEEWEVRALGELAAVTAGGTPSRTNSQYWGGDIPWVTTSEVDACTITHVEQFITKEGLSNSAAKLLPRGTLLMALYGQGKTRGKVGILGIDAATNQACAAISLHYGVSREFIFYLLASQYDTIRNLSNTGNQENLNGSLVRSISLLLPTEAEQQAIAVALGDVDALLGALERLITKKRDLKQATKQQLLTGQTRLPGFSGEWEETTLGAIGECIIGLTYDPNNVVEHGLLVLRSSNVQGGRLAYDNNVYVDIEVNERLITRPGDILICVRNGSRTLIGKSAVIDEYAAGTTFGAFMTVYRTSHWRFISHAFQSENIQRQIRDNIGATINQITNKDMKALRLKLPSSCEQTAIAAVLSDMDAELAMLERRLAKTRALKQGMMQELLTGRTRLL